MKLFRRTLRALFGLAGLVLGLATAVGVVFARRMIAPARQRLWATPAQAGMDYEEVTFPAQDGVRLSGWFIPGAADASRGGATIALVHGWGWNRLGYAADDMIANLTGSSDVDFLRLILALHAGGYNVLTFDLRNHGESAPARPVTFGQQEARDILGALAYLNGREDIDPARIGLVGFSMGANTVLYTLPQTGQIRAAVVVQPTTPAVFARRFASDMLGPFSVLVSGISQAIYRLFRGPRLGALMPAFAASGAMVTAVLYVQSRGDAWGSVQDVARMAEITPCAVEPLLVDGVHRFDGYQYLLDHPEVACRFFDEQLGGA